MHNRFDIEGEVIARTQSDGKKRPDGSTPVYRRVTLAWGQGTESVQFSDTPEGAKAFLTVPAVGEGVRVIGRKTQRVYEGKATVDYVVEKVAAGPAATKAAAA